MTTATSNLADLQGLISTESGLLLQALAAQIPANLAIVEIGSYKGKSACYMASQAVAQVHCIEPWDTPGNVFGKHGFTAPVVEQTFYAQVAAMGLAHKITVHKGFSHKVIAGWDKPIGMLYLDGSHAYDDVKRDFELYCRWLAPGAIVVFDDYNTRNNPGVTRYVNELKATSFLQGWGVTVPPAIVAYKRSLRTDVLLSSAIMAHPTRVRHIPYLQAKLPGTPVVWDQHNDRWDTGRRAMLAYNPMATHHVVVQDDALVCNQFLQGAANALAAVPPDSPVAFYTGKVRPSAQQVQLMVNKAHAQNSTWIAMDGPMWGVAVAVPIHLIQPMIAWGDKHPEIQNYDMRMARFFMTRKTECWYSLPSLVSHRTGIDEPSLIPGRGSGDSRVSHSFIGEQVDATTVAWTLDAVRPK